MVLRAQSRWFCTGRRFGDQDEFAVQIGARVPQLVYWSQVSHASYLCH